MKKENRWRSWNLGGMNNFKNLLNLNASICSKFICPFAKGDLERLIWVWFLFWVFFFYFLYIFFLIGLLPLSSHPHFFVFVLLFWLRECLNTFVVVVCVFYLCFSVFCFHCWGFFTLKKQMPNPSLSTLACKTASGYLGA